MSTKCDITVNKQMTLNTGNYNSIRPSISVTIKDVSISDVGKVTDSLTTLAQIYLEREILMLQQTKNEIDEQGGPKRWAEAMDIVGTDKVIKQLESELESEVSLF